MIDERLLVAAEAAAARLTQAQEQVERARAEYHQSIRRLHLAGASLRELAEALNLSHQRVHQIIEATGGVPDWRRRRDAADLSCSFCNAPKHAVGRLIAGPAVFICDRCVNRAGRAISGRPVRSLTVATPPTNCLFCGQSGHAVTVLQADTRAAICHGCVGFCQEVLAATAR